MQHRRSAAGVGDDLDRRRRELIRQSVEDRRPVDAAVDAAKHALPNDAHEELRGIVRIGDDRRDRACVGRPCAARMAV